MKTKPTLQAPAKILSCLVAALLLPASMQAAILFSEDFNYTVDQTLFGNSGGYGLTNSWTLNNIIGGNASSNNAIIRDISLSYSFTNGDTITANKSVEFLPPSTNGAYRNLATRQLENPFSGSEIYIRLLLQIDSGASLTAGDFSELASAHRMLQI